MDLQLLHLTSSLEGILLLCTCRTFLRKVWGLKCCSPNHPYFPRQHNGNDFRVDERRGCTHFTEAQGHQVILLKGNKAGGREDEEGLHTFSMSQKSLLDKVWMDRSLSGLTENTNLPFVPLTFSRSFFISLCSCPFMFLYSFVIVYFFLYVFCSFQGIFGLFGNWYEGCVYEQRWWLHSVWPDRDLSIETF